MIPRPLLRLWSTFSAAGLLIGTLLFAISLTPSLVPRPFALQVILSGVALAGGYGVGVLGRWLWDFMGLPHLPRRPRRYVKLAWAVISVTIAIVFLAMAASWQNSIRTLMNMEPAGGTRPILLGLLAVLLFVAIVAMARFFLFIARRLSRWLRRFVPRRVSIVMGSAGALILFWLIVEGVAVRFVLNTFERSFQQLDAVVEADRDPPASSALAGSPASLIDWQDLGRHGRRFVSGASTPTELEDFFREDTAEPVRVYVGLNAAETIAERAELALQELIRAGGFDREVLVVATPTGTGWIDPGSINSVEYLHRGDVASVAIQYSYLPSWLTLMTRPEYGAETARRLFEAVYGHWSAMDVNERPRLYLQGLSLGALNSERSMDVWDIVGDPIHGALWSGPPFRSDTWRWITENRTPDSPAWLPEFRDGSVIRFTNQYDGLASNEAGWGPLRIVYLQYASDPITFFEPDSWYREPEWMAEPRGPDVSEHLRWYPVITFMQLAADIAGAESAPIGYGHTYATEHYIDAWRAVSNPQGWDDAAINRLKETIGDLVAE
ncbi:alpha/beta-hydrolase family protein [Marinimicrobium sp. ABcell2]|uniref:alpha/beta hydrolase n=1 Tax=Marinimicrobium sp. ABcell2 TaxID=3069751 RepID=UPI0027B22888|nr:alpha/beta-hydrolase family protein [Marinimicrobium sp. ABcell2]MDQ2076756.1 alpha/beta-hydrolase family protein [Marinimicrobium sp. ABcell2]